MIKCALRRTDFIVEPKQLRGALLESDYQEIEVTADHVLAVGRLPLLHRDPFDRLLIAQAETEGAVLLTADRALVGYAGPVRFVG